LVESIEFLDINEGEALLAMVYFSISQKGRQIPRTASIGEIDEERFFETIFVDENHVIEGERVFLSAKMMR
jgi:hypothetical protein